MTDLKLLDAMGLWKRVYYARKCARYVGAKGKRRTWNQLTRALHVFRCQRKLLSLQGARLQVNTFCIWRQTAKRLRQLGGGSLVQYSSQFTPPWLAFRKHTCQPRIMKYCLRSWRNRMSEHRIGYQIAEDQCIDRHRSKMLKSWHLRFKNLFDIYRLAENYYQILDSSKSTQRRRKRRCFYLWRHTKRRSDENCQYLSFASHRRLIQSSFNCWKISCWKLSNLFHRGNQFHQKVVWSRVMRTWRLHYHLSQWSNGVQENAIRVHRFIIQTNWSKIRNIWSEHVERRHSCCIKDRQIRIQQAWTFWQQSFKAKFHIASNATSFHRFGMRNRVVDAWRRSYRMHHHREIEANETEQMFIARRTLRIWNLNYLNLRKKTRESWKCHSKQMVAKCWDTWRRHFSSHQKLSMYAANLDCAAARHKFIEKWRQKRSVQQAWLGKVRDEQNFWFQSMCAIVNLGRDLRMRRVRFHLRLNQMIPVVRLYYVRSG
jgi:hypothetical protein